MTNLTVSILFRSFSKSLQTIGYNTSRGKLHKLQRLLLISTALLKTNNNAIFRSPTEPRKRVETIQSKQNVIATPFQSITGSIFSLKTYNETSFCVASHKTTAVGTVNPFPTQSCPDNGCLEVKNVKFTNVSFMFMQWTAVNRQNPRACIIR